jgi:hypothetical protein
MLAAAWHYNRYGIATFSLDDIHDLATNVVEAVPS